MNRKHALILALFITLLIASNYYLFNNINKSERETAIIGRIIDGDTLELYDSRKIRLLNINTPEKNQPGYELAKNYLKIYENKSIELEITSTDKYGRNLARLYSNDLYINLELVKLGYTSKFLVQKTELKDFARAEENAIENNLGIWNKSFYYGCFNTDINKNQEIVIITNKCKEVNMKKWHLKDESRKIYDFPTLVLGKILLHSAQGIDNSTDLFWQSKTPIWNKDRDSLYLFDSNGGLAHYEVYGY